MKQIIISECHHKPVKQMLGWPTVTFDSSGAKVVWYECSWCHLPTGVLDVTTKKHLERIGSIGGKKAAANMTKEQRIARAKQASAARGK